MPSKIGPYTCTKTLGRGITSVVKLATSPDGKQFAIKIFDKENSQVDDQLLKALRAEVACLKEIPHHNNIVNMMEFQENGIWEKSSGEQKNIMYVVLELISGGELFDFVATGGALPENICRYYFRQMLSALHALHSKGTTHRDLKPENVLVDEHYNLRLADFGFAAPIEGRDGSGQLRTKLGTESYMAPEIHARQPYTGQSVDLFAIGIVLFIMMTGHPPFSQAVPQDRFYKFLSGNRADVFWRSHSRNRSGGFTKEFTDLLTCMFQLIPSQRLSMADVVGHPWMKGPMASPEDVQQEFRNRHEKILQGKMEEEQRRNVIKANRMNGAGGTFRGESVGQVMLGGEGEEGPMRSEGAQEPLKKLGVYESAGRKNTQFFTNYHPELIMEDLHKELLQMDGLVQESIKVHPKKYRVDFCISQNIIAMPEEEELEKETKQEASEEIALQSMCTIKLLQVDGSEKLAIEFSKASGSQTLFSQTYMHLQDKLADLNNIAE